MHLYGKTLDDYVRGNMRPAQLAAIDSHVSNCLFCAHALADEAMVTTGWERRGWLGRLVRSESPERIDTEREPEARAA
jgi:hypothetical protein